MSESHEQAAGFRESFNPADRPPPSAFQEPTDPYAELPKRIQADGDMPAWHNFIEASQELQTQQESNRGGRLTRLLSIFRSRKPGQKPEAPGKTTRSPAAPPPAESGLQQTAARNSSAKEKSFRPKLKDFSPNALTARALAAITVAGSRSKEAVRKKQATAGEYTRRPAVRRAAGAVIALGVAAGAVTIAHRSGGTSYIMEMGSELVSSLSGNNEAQSAADIVSSPPTAELPPASDPAPPQNTPSPEQTTPELVLAETVAETGGTSVFTGEINPDTGYYKGSAYDTIARTLLEYDIHAQKDIPAYEYYKKVEEIIAQKGLTMATATTGVNEGDTFSVDLGLFEKYLPAEPQPEPEPAEPAANDETAASALPPESGGQPAAPAETAANTNPKTMDKGMLALAVGASASLIGVSGYAAHTITKMRRLATKKQPPGQPPDSDATDTHDIPLQTEAAISQRNKAERGRTIAPFSWRKEQRYMPRHAAWLNHDTQPQQTVGMPRAAYY